MRGGGNLVINRNMYDSETVCFLLEQLYST